MFSCHIEVSFDRVFAPSKCKQRARILYTHACLSLLYFIVDRTDRYIVRDLTDTQVKVIPHSFYLVHHISTACMTNKYFRVYREGD